MFTYTQEKLQIKATYSTLRTLGVDLKIERQLFNSQLSTLIQRINCKTQNFYTFELRSDGVVTLKGFKMLNGFQRNKVDSIMTNIINKMNIIVETYFPIFLPYFAVATGSIQMGTNCSDNDTNPSGRLK